MATLHGRGGIVYLGAAAPITECRGWRINLDRALSEDTALGDTWRTQLMGIQSWGGSVSGNLDTAQATAFTAATATAVTLLYLYPDRTTLARYYYGNVWPKLSVDAPIGDVVRFTLDFEGDGVLTAV